jgi:hypothetical protein
MKPRLLLPIAALAAATAYAAFAPGGTAYTKRISTALLAEPAPLAETITRVAFARKLAIDEVRGPWVHVSDGDNAGWVFAGNLAEQKPAENRGLEAVPLTASETSASAAVRPLAPAAVDYAERRGLDKARDDVNWLVENTAEVTDEDVQTYKQTQKKGEFQ